MISIYNLVIAEKFPENLDNIIKDLEIYGEVIDFSKLKNKLEMYYKIKESNKLDTFEKILESFKKRDFIG